MGHCHRNHEKKIVSKWAYDDEVLSLVSQLLIKRFGLNCMNLLTDLCIC